MPPGIVLLLVLIMPGDKPDVTKMLPSASIEECVKDAGAFLKGDPVKAGGIALAAACRVVPAPQRDQ